MVKGTPPFRKAPVGETVESAGSGKMANASALLALSFVNDSAARRAAARRSSCCASVSGGSGGDGGTAGGGMRGVVVVASVELPSSSGDGDGSGGGGGGGGGGRNCQGSVGHIAAAFAHARLAFCGCSASLSPCSPLSLPPLHAF